jgi:zinc transport system substrate-binding protein
MFSFAMGCSGYDEVEQSDEGDLVVAVSILPQQTFVEKIAGDRVSTIVLIPPGASPATYEPTPGQLKEVSNADMYAIVGSGLPFEKFWLDRIEAVNEDMLIVDCAEGITLRPKDPHIWTSPREAKIMVENIYEGLVMVDPDNQEYYFQNKENYVALLDDVDARIGETLADKQGKSFMVYHPAWGYFADAYGLEMIPIEIEGKEPSPRDMQDVIDTAQEKGIKVIFVQAQFSSQNAGAIANEIDGEVVAIDPLSKDYVNNLELIAEAFSSGLV